VDIGNFDMDTREVSGVEDTAAASEQDRDEIADDTKDDMVGELAKDYESDVASSADEESEVSSARQRVTKKKKKQEATHLLHKPKLQNADAAPVAFKAVSSAVSDSSEDIASAAEAVLRTDQHSTAGKSEADESLAAEQQADLDTVADMASQAVQADQGKASADGAQPCGGPADAPEPCDGLFTTTNPPEESDGIPEDDGYSAEYDETASRAAMESWTGDNIDYASVKVTPAPDCLPCPCLPGGAATGGAPAAAAAPGPSPMGAGMAAAPAGMTASGECPPCPCLDDEEEPTSPPSPPPCLTVSTVVMPDKTYHEVDVDVSEQMKQTDNIGEEGRRPCDGPSDKLTDRVNMEMEETDDVGEASYPKVTWTRKAASPAVSKYDSLAYEVAKEGGNEDETEGTPCNPKPKPPPPRPTPVPDDDWEGRSHDENIAGGEAKNKMLERGGYDPDKEDDA
jgi:hypothetical protein